MEQLRSLIKKQLTTPEMIEKLKGWITENSGAKFSDFVTIVCQRCNFFNKQGKLDKSNCSTALRALETQGHINLHDDLQFTKTKAQKNTHNIHCLDKPIDEPVGVPATVDEIKHLELTRVIDPYEKQIWYTLIRDEHYLTPDLQPGIRILYLVKSEFGILGALSYSSAANRIKLRDDWIGWTDDQRQQYLDRVVNMSRFLIRPCIQCKNLASKVLGLSIKAVAVDCQAIYGFTPYVAESFVDSTRYEGVCYKSANWIMLGLTQGRGWNDRYNKNHLPKKYIFVYPIIKDFRKLLEVKEKDTRPAWVKDEALDSSHGFGSADWTADVFNFESPGQKDRNFRIRYSAEKIANSVDFSTIDGFVNDSQKLITWCNFIKSSQNVFNFESIMESIINFTGRRIKQEKLVLLPFAGTKINFTLAKTSRPPKAEPAGVMRDFILHTNIAETVDGVPLGIFDATCLDENSAEKSESIAYIKQLQRIDSLGTYLPDTELVSIYDADADTDVAKVLYEWSRLEHCQIIISSKSDCKIIDENPSLLDFLKDKNFVGTVWVNVPKVGKTKILHRAAELKILFRRVKVALPENFRAPIRKFNAIYVVESNPPKDVEPISWCILTSRKLNGFEDAAQCLEFYIKSYTLKEFFRILKVGCNFKELNSIIRRSGQYADFEVCESGLPQERLVAVYMAIALRRMYLLRFSHDENDLKLAKTFIEDSFDNDFDNAFEISVLKKELIPTGKK